MLLPSIPYRLCNYFLFEISICCFLSLVLLEPPNVGILMELPFSSIINRFER